MARKERDLTKPAEELIRLGPRIQVPLLLSSINSPVSGIRIYWMHIIVSLPVCMRCIGYIGSNLGWLCLSTAPCKLTCPNMSVSLLHLLCSFQGWARVKDLSLRL